MFILHCLTRAVLAFVKTSGRLAVAANKGNSGPFVTLKEHPNKSTQ
jgi:hypothetical protein